MNKGKKLIRFDWAMKKLLRDKANFDVLEGFLSVLLNEQITVKQILDSESNKKTDDDKHNRVDILVQNSKNELVIIEVQNSKEYDYFHRILFGTAKAISEHIKEGEAFASVKKVISITIAYFDLGQGQDYVYHGKNVFKGVHKGDILNLSERQIELYNRNEVHEIFPEYWLIKVSKFKNRINDRLDEWIYFFKNSEVKDSFTAQGLTEAKEKLDHMKLTGKELVKYEQYLKDLRNKASEQHTKMADAQELIDKALQKKEIETVINFHNNGVSIDLISKSLNLSEQRVEEIIKIKK
jgi:predicted transposase/invertase (TIGR01784 family)